MLDKFPQDVINSFIGVRLSLGNFEESPQHLGAVPLAVLLLDLVQLLAGDEFARQSLIIVIVKNLEVFKILNVKLGTAPKFGESFGSGVRYGDVNMLPAHFLKLHGLAKDATLSFVDCHALLVRLAFFFSHVEVFGGLLNF